MAYRVISLALVTVGVGLVLGLGACGKEIGDACTLSSDCDPNGARECDPDPASPNGYCTILGCDYSTCPDNSACIRFFTGSFENPPGKSCNADKAEERITCTLDELCSIVGKCVPRSSEVRYCMRTCGSNGDCRDGYECRNFDTMKQHGGEPVLAPGVPVDEAHAPKFCAVQPRA